MRHVWLTARYELRTTLSRKSFWLTTILLPAAFMLLVFVADVFSPGGQGEGTPTPAVDTGTQPIGYVDSGHLLNTLPTHLPPGTARRYEDEPQAQAALARAEIDRYYLIPADYLASGQLTVVEARYQPLRALGSLQLITYVINTGTTGSETLAELLVDPTPELQSSALSPSGALAPEDATLGRLLPYSLMFILYLALAMTSGYMLQSVSKEKEDRTAEVLLLSVKPRDLMLGKIAGLSAVGLLQVAVWLAVFFGVLLGRGSIAGIDLNISGAAAAQAIPWTLAYFLLGYLMYASVYGVLSVLAPTARDANHFVYVAIVPLVVPLLLSGTFSEAPNGALATALSLFPLTSPIAMVARLGAALVPWWQSLAGLFALGIFAYLFVLLAARLFSAENLLSSRTLSWGRIVEGLHRPGVSRETGPTQSAVSIGSGGPAARQATSKSRALSRLIGAAALVIVGVVEIARSESLGIVMLVLGIALGAREYLRSRGG